MPIVFSTVYLDPPAIIRTAAHSSTAGGSFAATSPLAHLQGSTARLQGSSRFTGVDVRVQPLRDPQGFSSGPDTATPSQPTPQPHGFSSGPDAAKASRLSAQPQGFSSGPDIVTSPQPSPQPQGFSSGPDVATRSQ
jgi:hypothetical protein